jgi:hypothetical protein
MGFFTGLSTPSVSGQKAYEGLFDAKLTASNIKPLDALFADGEKGSCRQHRRRKGTS